MIKLKLQTFLENQGIEMLQKQLAIKVYRHPELPLVGFKYNQIDSPRTHEVVRECRGVVLEDKTWKLVAKPFSRFFNVGEVENEFKTFNWAEFDCIDKVDGSLIIMYHYENEWHVNTSGSFGLGDAHMYDGSWRKLFWDTCGIDKTKLLPSLTYILELCTPYNRVVKDYGRPTVFLLGLNDIYHGQELPEYLVDDEAQILGIERPKTYSATNLAEVTSLLEALEDTDELQEGVVIRDSNGMRFKWKTQRYVALHRLNDNGNILLARNLMTIALTGEVSETVVYFPVKNALAEVEAGIQEAINDIYNNWFVHGDIASQKKFALKVKEHKFASILFQMRKDLEWSSENQDAYIRKLFLKDVKRMSELLFRRKSFQFDPVLETNVSE
jgi:hypothetical protein